MGVAITAVARAPVPLWQLMTASTNTAVFESLLYSNVRNTAELQAASGSPRSLRDALRLLMPSCQWLGNGVTPLPAVVICQS